jgi:general nucleoside transport system permease protein
MVLFAVGDTYSLSETLVKTAPILLCALATLLPARLGLVSVGADGQLFMGAIFGTAVMLAWRDAPPSLLVPAMIAAGMAGGAIWGLMPGFLRGRLDVNETITTLLLNYVAALLVNALVYGPWKDPGNLGWPATIAFPTTSLGAFFGTRVHAGLLFGLAIALVLGVVLARSRWGLAVGLVIVARWNPYLVIPTALLFGVSETAVLRLQAAGVAISPSLLATMPYLLALMVIVLAQSQAWRAGSMPADLTAIFRNSATSD